MIKLYHGTNLSSAFDIYSRGVDLSKSLPDLDFGKGFYVTDSRQKAINRAIKKTAQYNRRYKCTEEAYIVEVYINENLFDSLKYKKFEFRSEEWFRFVVNNRLSMRYLELNNITNHNRDNKYDIVFGEIADGTVTKLANFLEEGLYNINDLDFSAILPDNKQMYGYQYSFHTKESLCCIEKVICDIIKINRKRVF